MKISGGQPVTFDILISEDGPWELSYQDGVTLPNLKMVEDGRCPFLNEKGRCNIHPIRSGLCRLFPLGRGFEEDGSVTYYVLDSRLGCEKLKGPGSMVRIKDWLSIEDIEKYEAFQSIWHRLRLEVAEKTEKMSFDDSKRLQERFLRIFYEKSYAIDFYKDFDERVEQWKNCIC